MRRHDRHRGRARTTRPLAACTLAVAIALGAWLSLARAQQVEGRSASPPPPPPPAASAPSPLAGSDLVVMDFQDVEIATLVKFISEITGKNFLLDDKVKGKVSVISPSKITVDEAYRVFQSVLQVKGFTLVDTGPVVKIIAIKDVKGSSLPIGAETKTPSEAYVTQLVPLEHLEAQAAAQLLQPLVSRDGLISAYTPTNSLIVVDAESNIARLVELITSLDVPGQERTVEVIPLKHAFANDVAGILREAIEDDSARGSGPVGGSNAPASIPGVASSGGGKNAGRGPTGIRVVPDERSNAVVVIGNQIEIRQAYALVAKLDRPLPKGTGRINVYYLQHADATEMVQVLADLVGTTTSTVPRQILPGRAVTEGGGRFGSGSYRSATGSQSLGNFGRSTLGGQTAGALPGTGRSASQPGVAGGVQSAGSGGPAVEFESGVRVTADPATNSLVISAAPQDYATLRDVIQQLDIPRRQVLVEAIIFEVSMTKAKQLGIELQGGASVDGKGVAFGRVNFRNLNSVTQTIQGGDLSGIGNLTGLLGALISDQSIVLSDGTKIPAGAVLVSALQADTDINVLSAPTIMTTDNEEAEIVVGQNVPFVTSRSTNETNLANTFSQVDRRDVGITLRLTPQISEGDTVRLLLFQEVSALVPTSQTEVLQLGPTTTVRSATTSVVVKDSQTVAIGGLISDSMRASQQGVPYLSDIPVLGNLFKYDDKSKEKVNLIILLTPKILRNPTALTQLTDEERERFHKAVTGRRVFSGTLGKLDVPPPPPPPYPPTAGYGPPGMAAPEPPPPPQP
ncbi:type II secretion system secretin GspD, partial [Candidatus Binatia bacterium]|nr:type II secretion system secretin GspD [Candidatus Binatia bacterium]